MPDGLMASEVKRGQRIWHQGAHGLNGWCALILKSQLSLLVKDELLCPSRVESKDTVEDQAE
jgi:hypothetical protein